jgi:hypothetical protein
MNKYKIYCETDGKWEYVIASSEPTQCPIDGGHTVRAGSVSIVENDVKENPNGVATSLTLDEYKDLKNNSIDRRTGELIELGFEFPPASGKLFSLSPNAQTNILALDHTRDDVSMTYPINYNTIDDKDVYAVPDSATLHNMYLTALSVKKSHLDSGTLLKDDVRAAVDEAAVDLVTDSR